MTKQKQNHKSWTTWLAYISQAFNFIAILAICAASIVRFTYFGDEDPPKEPFFYILTFYLIPFAALLAIAELRW